MSNYRVPFFCRKNIAGFLTLGFFLLHFSGVAQTTSIKESWEPLLKEPGLAEYFSGVFESLGIHVAETGEEVTIVHKTDHFEIKNGISRTDVDYAVTIREANVMNMAGHGKDGIIDAYESYRIMSVLFTPLTRAALENPMMNKALPQKLAGIENHVHVYLESPANDEFVAHTLLFHNKKWLVIEGIHGEARRIFRMSPDQALEYQREVFKAEKTNTRKAWKKFMKFYLDWRKGVSVEAGKNAYK